VAYFRLPVTSDKASIFRTALWELSIVKTAIGSNTPLLTHDLMDGGANTALGDSYELDSSFGGAAAAGAPSAVLFELVVKTGAAHLNLVQDEIVQVTLTATVRVQYQNAGQVSIVSNDEFVEMRGFVGELASVGVASSSVAHSLAATGGARGEGLARSSAASSSGISAPAFIGIVVAVSALVAIVAAVVVVRVKRTTPAIGESSGSSMQLTAVGAPTGEMEPGNSTATPSVVDNMTMREVMAAYDGETTV
jgi:hypothetical protein